MECIDAICKLARLLIRLFYQEFDVVHQSRINIKVADALSQLTVTKRDKIPFYDEIPEIPVTAVYKNDRYDSEADTNKDPTARVYEDLDDEALKPK